MFILPKKHTCTKSVHFTLIETNYVHFAKKTYMYKICSFTTLIKTNYVYFAKIQTFTKSVHLSL